MVNSISSEDRYPLCIKDAKHKIEQLCKEVDVDADLVFGHLMKENPTFDYFISIYYQY